MADDYVEGAPGLAYGEQQAPTLDQDASTFLGNLADYPEALAEYGAQAGGSVASAIQYMGRSDPELAQNADAWRKFFTYEEQEQATGVSPEGRRALQENMTDADWWRHPIRATLLGGLSMAPMMAGAAAAAYAAPEELAGTAIGAALGAAGGGGLNVGFGMDDIYKMLDDKSDADLMNNVIYKTARQHGASEFEARQELADKMAGISPLINFATGAAATTLGPVGKMFGIPLGTAGAKLGRRVLEGAAETGLGLGVQSGALEYGTQYAQSVLDPSKQFDPTAVATAALSGVVGGVEMGGAFGVLPHKVPGVEEKAPGTKVPVAPPETPTVPETGGTPETGDVASQGTPPRSGNAGAQAASMAQEPAAKKPGADVTAGPTVAVKPAEAAGAAAEQALPAAAAATAEGTTVPESRSAFQAQVEQLVNGQRAAVVFPKGTKAADMPPQPAGMLRASGGMKGVAAVYFDPKSGLTHADVRKAVQEGRINEIIGIGPYNKADIAEKIQAGEPAVGVVGRDQAGNEVKSAIGTPSTVPEQAAEIGRDPNLTVSVEHPAETLKAREDARAAEEPGAKAEPAAEAKPAEVAPAAEAAPAEKPAEAAPAAKETVGEKLKKKAKAKKEAPAEKPAETGVTREGKSGTVIRVTDPAVKAKYEEAERARQEMLKAEKATTGKRAKAEAEREAHQAALDKAKEEGKDVEAVKADLMKGKGHKGTLAEKAERADTNNSAKVIVDAHPESDIEKRYRAPGESGQKARAAIIERARAMVKMAEDHGYKWPGSIKRAMDPGYAYNGSTVMLAEARRLVRLFREKGGGLTNKSLGEKVKYLDEYLSREAALRRGNRADVDRIIEARTIEAELAKKAEAKGGSEEAEESAGKPGEKAAAPTEESPEERLSAKQEREASEAASDEEEAAVEGGGREREPTKLKGDEVTLGKDSTGSFMVETKKKRRGPPTPDGPAYRRVPKVDPAEESHEYTHEDFIDDNKRYARLLADKKPQKLADVLPKLVAASKQYPILRLFEGVMRDRLTRIIGNLPVYFVSNEEMRALTNNRGGDEGRVAGFYNGVAFNIRGDPELAGIPGLIKDAIIIGYEDTPDEIRHTVMHEAMHAATVYLTYRHPKLAEAYGKIAGELQAALLADPESGFKTMEDIARSQYGFTNVREFIAEAFANPRLQEMLAKYQMSDALAKEIGFSYGGQFKSLFRGMMAALRKYIKLGDYKPAEMSSMMEGIFRLNEEAFDALAEHNIYRPEIRWRGMPDFVGQFIGAPAEAETKKFISPLAKDLSEETPFRRSFTHMGKTEGNEPLWSEALPPKRSERMALARLVEAQSPQPSEAVTMRTIAEHIADGTKAGMKDMIHAATNPAAMASKAISTAAARGRQAGDVSRWILSNLSTFAQVADWHKDILPMAPEISRVNDEQAVHAKELMEPLNDVNAELTQFYNAHPELQEKANKLLMDQSRYGVDASQPLGVGRNAHITTSKEMEAKLAKGAKDVDHENSINQWKAREKHPELSDTYKDIVGAAPEFAGIQERAFKATEAIQAGMDSEHRARVEATLGKKAADELGVGRLIVRKGPYIPMDRFGDHAVVGKYKVTEPGNAIRKIGDDTWEFKNRKDAHEFAVKKNGDLHTETEIRYYDPKTGKQTTKDDVAKDGTEPEQRYAVQVHREHFEKFDTAEQARQRVSDLKEHNNNLFDELRAEEQRSDLRTSEQFTNAATKQLLKRLEQTEGYQKATEGQKALMRQTIIETSIRNQSGNRIQHRRLVRRNVRGASEDVTRVLDTYNVGQANYRARLAYAPKLDKLTEDMERHIQANRNDKDNARRREVANEIHRRLTMRDPDQTSGAFTKFTRKLMMYSYVARMVRASHLILRQTHLPMITAPVIAGRHGALKTYAMLTRTWRDLGGAYKAGGKDFVASLADALHKGTNYEHLFADAVKDSPDGARLAKLFRQLVKEGLIHPQAGYEFSKYLPHETSGVMDRAVQRVDTVYRHLTNATEAINRFVGASTAYRLEYDKLTRAGKSSAEAHEGAVNYARQIIEDTQGKFSPSNTAPLFKNKYLRPFLQFKQFPQMMYHLIAKLAVKSFGPGVPKDERIEAMKSLGMLLGAHMMMAGALQGLPLEPLKALAWIAKGIGLTSGDWNDVEDSVRKNLSNAIGKDASSVVLNGMGATAFGVDVHHRLGLDSFWTYGLPEKNDDASTWEFLATTAMGAPGSLAADAVHGIKKMITANDYNDVIDGGMQMMPAQALRDTKEAIFGGAKPDGYTPGAVDRIKRVVGFTPAAEAEARSQEQAVHRAVSGYNTQRRSLIAKWVGSSPESREAQWERIQEFNSHNPSSSRIDRGTLMKALAASKKAQNVAGVKVNKETKGLAEQAASYY